MSAAESEHTAVKEEPRGYRELFTEMIGPQAKAFIVFLCYVYAALSVLSLLQYGGVVNVGILQEAASREGYATYRAFVDAEAVWGVQSIMLLASVHGSVVVLDLYDRLRGWL